MIPSTQDSSGWVEDAFWPDVWRIIVWVYFLSPVQQIGAQAVQMTWEEEAMKKEGKNNKVIISKISKPQKD